MQTSTNTHKSETRMLGAIALTCYVTTLAGLFVAGYTVFTLAACGLEQGIFAAYTRQIF